MAELQHPLIIAAATATIVLHDKKGDCTEVALAQFSEQGHLLQFDPTIAITDLPAIPNSKHVTLILLIAARHLLLTRVNLPKSSTHELHKAVPFALEDQMLEDLDELHFAISAQDPQQEVLVAVINKTILTRYLTTFAERHYALNYIYPELFALPVTEQQWVVIGDGDEMRVATSEWQGGVVRKAQLNEFLTACLAQSQRVPQRIAVYSNEAMPVLLPAASINCVKHSHFDWQDSYQRTLQHHTWPLQLLQGAFKRYGKQNTRQGWYRQLTWGLVGVGLGLLVLAKSLGIHQLLQQQQILSKAIEQIYFRVFPDARAVVAPRVRFERKLSELQSTLGREHFWPLLLALGEGLQAVSHVTLIHLDYADQSLQAIVTLPSSVVLNSLVTRLTTAGITVKTTAVSTIPDGLQANLTLRAP